MHPVPFSSTHEAVCSTLFSSRSKNKYYVHDKHHLGYFSELKRPVTEALNYFLFKMPHFFSVSEPWADHSRVPFTCCYNLIAFAPQSSISTNLKTFLMTIFLCSTSSAHKILYIPFNLLAINIILLPGAKTR